VPREPRRPLRALDARSFAVLAAVAERVAPGGPSPNGAAFPSASDVMVPEKIDALLATCDPAMTGEVSQALLLLENALAGLVLDGRARAFTACDADEQEAILEGWRTSRLHLRRQVYKALRGLCASAYYASPEVYAAVGYPGPPSFGEVPG
ncbi:MAG TPA: gluconate 2-dehydrogenase subunit 3 family protein, partial [Myxococcota bacterium]|nr:gluconate 2-dehydrogenase subunit 3 family protein [Myxococcota bacterium]